MTTLQNKFSLIGLWLAEHPQIVTASVALMLLALLLAGAFVPQHAAWACPAGGGGSGIGGCGF